MGPKRPNSGTDNGNSNTKKLKNQSNWEGLMTKLEEISQENKIMSTNISQVERKVTQCQDELKAINNS